MTGRGANRFLGRAFLGDSLAPIVSACAGGIGVTTYAENIGVMAAGRIWVEDKVVFSNPRNLITVAVAFTAGAGNLTLNFGTSR